MNKGKIVQVSGPVVDVEFLEGKLPKLRDALEVVVDGDTQIMEVSQLLGNRRVRCIILSQSEGLFRGMEVTATGHGITVPVGDKTIGRMFNVLGKPIDGGEEVSADDGKININTASESQLCDIPGIGAVRAAAIASYRQEHGAFETIEDIMKVSGIKQGTYDKIKDSIIVN